MKNATNLFGLFFTWCCCNSAVKQVAYTSNQTYICSLSQDHKHCYRLAQTQLVSAHGKLGPNFFVPPCSYGYA